MLPHGGFQIKSQNLTSTNQFATKLRKFEKKLENRLESRELEKRLKMYFATYICSVVLAITLYDNFFTILKVTAIKDPPSDTTSASTSETTTKTTRTALTAIGHFLIVSSHHNLVALNQIYGQNFNCPTS